MSTFNIAVQIGATLTQGFRSTLRSSSTQLNQLGDSLDKLKRQQAAVRRIEVAEGNVGKARVAYNAAVGDVVRLRRELAQTQQPSRQLTQSFEAARQKAERLSGALGQQRERLQRARQALRDTGLSTENLAADNRRLGQSVERLSRQYGRLGKAMRAQQANQARRAQLRGQLFDAAAIGATVAAPLTVAVQFEQSVAKLGAITGRGDEAMDQANRAMLEQEARRLGETTQFSASQSVDAMTFLGMAGFSPEQIRGATAGVLNLAQAAGSDLADTADIASNILSGFSLDATQDMGRVGDVLTATFTTSNTTLQSLGETLKFVAPVASAAGGSIEQVAAMVGLLGDVGIQGSRAGTALRATFLRLSAPTGSAAKALDNLGISVADLDGNLRPVPEILNDLANATGDLGTTQQTEAIKAIFGEEAAAGVTELLKQARTGAIDTEIAKLENAQGSTERIAKKMSATTLGSLKRLGSALESVAISVGNVLLPTIASGAELFAKIASGVSQFATTFPLLTKVVVGATTALIALRVVTIAGGFAYTFVKGAVLSLRTAYLALTSGMVLQKTAMVSINTLSAITAVRIGLVTAAQWAWNVALTANPIGLIIVGIGALIGAGVLLIKHWDKVKSFFASLWSGMKKITGAAVNWLLDTLGLLLNPFKLLTKTKDIVIGSIGKLFGGDQAKKDSTELVESASPNTAALTIGGAVNQSTAAPNELASLSRAEASIVHQQTTQSTVIDAPITIHASPGMDERAVAIQVRQELDQREAQAEARRRTQLFDAALV